MASRLRKGILKPRAGAMSDMRAEIARHVGPVLLRDTVEASLVDGHTLHAALDALGEAHGRKALENLESTVRNDRRDGHRPLRVRLVGDAIADDKGLSAARGAAVDLLGKPL